MGSHDFKCNCECESKCDHCNESVLKSRLPTTISDLWNNQQKFDYLLDYLVQLEIRLNNFERVYKEHSHGTCMGNTSEPQE